MPKESTLVVLPDGGMEIIVEKTKPIDKPDLPYKLPDMDEVHAAYVTAKGLMVTGQVIGSPVHAGVITHFTSENFRAAGILARLEFGDDVVLKLEITASKISRGREISYARIREAKLPLLMIFNVKDTLEELMRTALSSPPVEREP